MIHSAPTIDFAGSIQVSSLEIGSIYLNDQSIPAVKFCLKQNQIYPLLASGQVAGEIYAYCAVSRENAIDEIDSTITSALVMDAGQRLHVVATSVTWFTSNALRRKATAKVLHILQGTDPAFVYNAQPFATIRTVDQPKGFA